MWLPAGRLAVPRDWNAPERERRDAEARERIAEIGEILALGLIRLRSRQSSQLSSGTGESSLASLGHQSGHENHKCVESSS
jgi:hypothetical protein